ncbi:hypothetical protein [Clostridium cellulovorans]|uniref:Uncharacterized protein n=1 Tax=Clostridium cellulovorans (strain ATCC 35296 / DSM 3052 / OCM 3 / 743B) TaxID=573061 RepID=D9SUS0_CLOC7|nr:hypothetical protein [Clostridium cellulovorans]ADL50975.1 hypothetical protein Clocel_1220 [Clostridium cellulovorans 743B]
MTTIAGGWSVHETITDEDKEVFETALQGIVGVNYTPIAVASQIVNGVNYIFIAKATPSALAAKTGLAKIYISAVPAGAEPTLINIERIV